MRIRRGAKIPRSDGKQVEELVGYVHTRTRELSLARMLAPPGWAEPAQVARFDEVVYVLRGELTVAVAGRNEHLVAGEAGFYARGQRVSFQNRAGAACEYLSVCVPAFRKGLVRVDEATRRLNAIEVDSAVRSPMVGRVRSWAARFLEQLGVDNRSLHVMLVNDPAIRTLNRRHRRIDKATDVLSFPAGEMPAGTPGPLELGTVVISLETAKRQAREHRCPLASEVSRYLAHGLLHLLGYDHQGPKQARAMARQERALLGTAGMLE